EAVRTVLTSTALGDNYTPIAEVIDEKAIVNAIIGLLATGGSTNHTLHLVAVAAAAGVVIDWDDFDELSSVVPLLARVYPNGLADVNHFHAAGGLGFMMSQLLDAGFLHADVNTILGHGLDRFCQEPNVIDGKFGWQPVQSASLNEEVLRPADNPFDKEGGLRVVDGNMGRAIVKISAVEEEYYSINAPARVFHSQQEFTEAFNEGELERDFVAVLPYQGPQANGMPELHKLTPYLGVLQNRGFKVALLTDGRMSGASGKVLAAIQVTPEACAGGLVGKIEDEDMIEIDATTGKMSVAAADAIAERDVAVPDIASGHSGMGRELFAAFRHKVSSAETGATVFAGEE
ncbi:MAG: dihydroxy-acid dehydratase, partial [Woeseiaceae bacterium]